VAKKIKRQVAYTTRKRLEKAIKKIIKKSKEK
jgi:hypothetical protein